MLTSSRDNWERLVGAVVKRQQIWELCHQQSRTPSICSAITSDDDSSEQFPSFSGSNFEPFSVPPSPLLPPTDPSSSQVKTSAVGNNASPRSITQMLFSALYGRRKSKDQHLDDIPEYTEGQLERFSLRQLQVATDTFSAKNFLGRGGFGKVYKGQLVDGTLVAVKRLNMVQKTGEEIQFQTEVQMFSSMAVHRNILRLRGFCTTTKERLLVYPYMAKGSVASCLRERLENVPPLDWGTRERIALGIARGLSFLHDQCNWKIIHRNVKAAKVLLDEEYGAVVVDFSLAKLMDHNEAHVDTAVRGTTGHIAPEYLSTGKMSEKSDVYGYGVTLLELITAQRAFDLARLAYDEDVMLPDWMKGLLKEKKLETIVDPDLHSNYVYEEVEQLIQIALLCTQSSALGRPKMSEVVRLLEGDGLAEKWDEWQKVEMTQLEVELGVHSTSYWIIVRFCCSTVGVSGLISGGGYGYMIRKFGMAADHVLDAVIIDVNGRILNRKSMGEDLFWAIRGGGGASFGVIVSWKLQLVDVPATITNFVIQRTVEQNLTGLLYRWQYVAPRMDPDLTLMINANATNSTEAARGITVDAMFFGIFLGGADRLLALMQRNFPELGMVRADCTEMSWLQSSVVG